MEAGGSDGEMDGFGVAVSREAMGKLAESGDRETIYQAGDTIRAYLAGLGFNVDFAPDADVLADAENQAIGDRSFGTDPQVVASMAWAFAEALHHNGILAAYKHFPGHGGTKEDSHSGYAYVHKTLEELRQTELVPFQDGCDRGRGFHHGVPYLWPRRSQAATCRPLCPEVWWRIC